MLQKSKRQKSHVTSNRYYSYIYYHLKVLHFPTLMYTNSLCEVISQFHGDWFRFSGGILFY